MGLATEAAKATLRFGFEELKLERIVVVAAQRVMSKLGMTYEKTDRYYGDNLVYYAISRAAL